MKNDNIRDRVTNKNTNMNTNENMQEARVFPLLRNSRTILINNIMIISCKWWYSCRLSIDVRPSSARSL